MKGDLPHYTYILRMSNGKHYTGMTKDIKLRLSQHEKGYSKSTRWFRPLVCLWVTEVKDRTAARRLEVKIKNRGAKLFLLDQRFRPNRIHRNIL